MLILITFLICSACSKKASRLKVASTLEETQERFVSDCATTRLKPIQAIKGPIGEAARSKELIEYANDLCACVFEKTFTEQSELIEKPVSISESKLHALVLDVQSNSPGLIEKGKTVSVCLKEKSKRGITELNSRTPEEIRQKYNELIKNDAKAFEMKSYQKTLVGDEATFELKK